MNPHDEVEQQLLFVLKSLDKSVFIISQKIEDPLYHKAVDNLIAVRVTVKKVLNDHFDQLAQKRNSIANLHD